MGGGCTTCTLSIGATWEPGAGGLGPNAPLAVLTLTSLTLTELGPPQPTQAVCSTTNVITCSC